MSRALASALKAAQLAPADAALVALARAMARAIDDRAHLADVAQQLLDEAERQDDDATAAALQLLQQKLQLRATLSDLSPKFLALLTALKLTPAARAAIVEGGPVSGGSDDVVSRLRDRRAARPH